MFAVGVILASQGYPISSSKGQIITGINDVLHTNFVFHSGTNISSKGELITNGTFYIQLYIYIKYILYTIIYFIYIYKT